MSENRFIRSAKLAILIFLIYRKNFSFKCHRDDAKNVYSVNDISFHPVYGTFSTAGSDGLINIWDKDRKQRLKEYPKVNGTVSCTAFNRNGSILAYAISYDWSKVSMTSIFFFQLFESFIVFRDTNTHQI